MLTGRYTRRIWIMPLWIAILVNAMITSGIRNFANGETSIMRGLGLFEAGSALLALTLMIVVSISLYRSVKKAEWKQGTLYLNGARTLARVRAIDKISDTTIYVRINWLFDMRLTGQPEEVAAFCQAASQDRSIPIGGR